jgi:hypothetical protein
MRPNFDTFCAPRSRRIECLCACLTAAKSWIDAFLAIPPADWPGLPLSTYMNLTHCCVSLCRLSTYEHPEWDRGLVQEYINLSNFLGKAEEKFRKVKEAAGIDSSGSESPEFFSFLASKAKLIKTSWDMTNNISTTNPVGTALNDEMGELLPGFDDDWLREIFNL